MKLTPTQLDVLRRMADGEILRRSLVRIGQRVGTLYFIGEGRINGAVVSLLQEKGVVQRVGAMSPATTYKLTPAGRKALEDAT